MDLKTAADIAVKICFILQPNCELIHLAGSIRRRKPEVKDIEIVCSPKVEVLKDMFGNIYRFKPFNGECR